LQEAGDPLVDSVGLCVLPQQAANGRPFRFPATGSMSVDVDHRLAKACGASCGRLWPMPPAEIHLPNQMQMGRNS
jgi:hypothetical protein